ncbi:helix-turn-helix domain-containing protein [Agrobacterium sp. P15N1-A]|uniref:helix-turn-helix domain-containing protein n=1 Tax=Agrobacterium sp. P15N1-A TaxID=3342820 RepID=UPI0037D51D48
MELKFIKDRQRAGIDAVRAEGVYKGRKKNVDDDEIRRCVAVGASKASVARELKVSRMTVSRALDIIPSKTELPEKPPAVTIALHLIIENSISMVVAESPLANRSRRCWSATYVIHKK